MQITLRDTEKLAGVLKAIGSTTSPFLVYFVATNGQKIEPSLKALTVARRVVDGYPAYADAHRALCEEHAHKDVNGLAQSKQHKTDAGLHTAYSIKDHDEYGKAFEALNVKYADVLVAHMAHQVGLAELLTTVEEVPLLRIKMSQCGEDIITGDIAKFLMALDLLEWDIDKLSGSRHLEAVKE